jgi:UDP-N-acetylmuramate--alanine ligase
VEVLDVYAASEEPIPGADAAALVSASTHSGMDYAGSVHDAIRRLLPRLQPGDAVLTLGAGNVSQAVPLLLEALKARSTAETTHR